MENTILCVTSFKRELESHRLMEHNWFVCLDSKLSKRAMDIRPNHQKKTNVCYVLIAQVYSSNWGIFYWKVQSELRLNTSPYQWSKKPTLTEEGSKKPPYRNPPHRLRHCLGSCDHRKMSSLISLKDKIFFLQQLLHSPLMLILSDAHSKSIDKIRYIIAISVKRELVSPLNESASSLWSLTLLLPSFPQLFGVLNKLFAW